MLAMTEQRDLSPSNPAAEPPARICVAAVAGAHGVKGLVRLKPFTEVPEDCVAYGPLSSADGSRTYAVKLMGQVKAMLLARMEGVTDRNQAEALRGTRLYVPRDVLPAPADEDEFYHADLVGLAAMLADGTEIGKVGSIYDFGAGTLLELIHTVTGKPLLIPFTREAVPEIDIAGGKVVIDPPPGLLDGPTEPDEEGADEAANDKTAGEP